MTVEGNTLESDNQEYLAVRCNHSYGTQKYLASAFGSTEEVYRGFYEFLPSDVPFRMLPLTPKPRVLGIEWLGVVLEATDAETIPETSIRNAASV